MSQVLETKRKKQPLEVFVKQVNLICYTIQITSGKTFAPAYQYQAVIVSRIVSQTIDIYTLSWEANNIRVGSDREKYRRRKELQQRAIERCDSLLGLILVAKMMFHLSGKRYEYWCRRVMEVKDMTMTWKEKDIKGESL